MWLTTHEAAFLQASQQLAAAPNVSFYVNSPLLRRITHQQQSDGQLKIVQTGSRQLLDAETRYAMIELELLAAAWAM